MPEHFISAGRPVPSAADLAWLSVIPTTAPALTAEEVGRLTALRTMATEPRVIARIDAILAA